MSPWPTLAVLALVTSTVSCAATTYDTSISTQTAAPTTTVLPTGTAAQVLPTLVATAADLSNLIADQGDKTANVERVEALWAAVQAEVAVKDRDIATEIAAEIVKGRDAARLNRPAAADKVYRSLKDLVQAYLSLP